nr:MAG TPA: hypothetical protein [Caudoviricetes sp.]
MRPFLFKGIQYLIISNSASYASLKQKKVDLIDQPHSLHSTCSLVAYSS